MRDTWTDEDMIIRRMQDEIDWLKARNAEVEKLLEKKNPVELKLAEQQRIAYQQTLEIDAIRARAEKAEAMVERLLVAGRDLICTTEEEFPDISGRWIALVEKWEGRDD